MSLAALERSGRLRSGAAALRRLGFRSCWVEPDPLAFEELVVAAASEALDASGARARVGHLFLYSALGGWDRRSPRGRDSALARFRYPAARLAQRLGLSRVSAIGLSQQGCSGLLSAVKLAAATLEQSGGGAALCVAGDALPPGASREILFSLMSDAAAAVVVELGADRDQIVAFHQLSEAAYWDTPRHQDELASAYFPMAKLAIVEALERARLTLADIRWFVPSNVSLRSWRILAEVLGVGADKICTEMIASAGHTVSCDHIINLVEMERAGALRRGDHLLLFTFGFGASWSVLIIRH